MNYQQKKLGERLKFSVYHRAGIASIVAVIIVASIVVSFGILVALNSVTDVENSLFMTKSNAALEIADACAEEAYFRLKLDNSFTGTTLNFSDGSCTVSVTGGGSTRSLAITATIDDFTRTISATVDLTSNIGSNADGIDLTHWE